MNKQGKRLEFRIICMILSLLMVLSSVSPMYAQDIGEYERGSDTAGEAEGGTATGSAIGYVGAIGYSTSGSAITGEGTQDSPYVISTEEDLRAVASEINKDSAKYEGKYFKIEEGHAIELTGEWVPIGTETNPFKGNFDGSSTTVSGIRADGATTPSGISYYGFFGYVENAEIKNLTVSGSAINYDNAAGISGNSKNSSFVNCVNNVNLNGKNTGGIAAAAANSIFENCINRGEIKSTGTAGGIVSEVSGGTKIRNSYNISLVEGKISGGIVGNISDGTASVKPELDRCYNEGTVRGTDYTGGIAGKAGKYCVLKDCFNKGQVDGSGKYTAGVAAFLGTEATVDNCYNASEGDVTGSGEYTTGVFGEIKSNIKPGSANTKLEALYNAGTVRGTGTYASGVLGSVPAGMQDSIKGCYNTGAVVGTGDYAAGICGSLAGVKAPGRDFTSRLNRCYNLGKVLGEGENTLASGICGENILMPPMIIASWTVDCFNYGDISAGPGNIAAIMAKSFDFNENSYYLAGSTGEIPIDSTNAVAKNSAEFCNGEIAYLLDSGNSARRTENWGQGDNYPVPVSEGNPPVYKMTVEVTGEGENKAIYKGVEASAGSPADIYAPVEKKLEISYELSEGYLIDKITSGADDLNIAFDEEAKTFSFTLKEHKNTSLSVSFTKIPEGLKDTYNVVYDANGGQWMDGSTILTDEVKVGGRASKPLTEPYFEELPDVNNVFRGWFADKECTVPYNFTSAVIGDTTIYAGWLNMQRYIVTFDAAGGSIENNPSVIKEVVHGNAVEKPGTDPVKDGFDFRGWYIDESCLHMYDFENRVMGEFTLYAGWAPEGKCVVVFDANGGTITQNEESFEAISVTVDKETAVSEPVASKEPKGSIIFDLDGWYTGDGNKWDFSTHVTQSMTLTAKWKENYKFMNPIPGEHYEIDSVGALEALRDAVNSGIGYENIIFDLITDIHLPSNWTAIGSTSFNGTFDGGGNTIYLNEQQKYSIFDKMSGTVKNLKVKSDYVSGLDAAIAVYLKGGEINNCEVWGIFDNSNAGIVYQATDGTIKECVIKSGTEISGTGSVAGILSVSESEGLVGVLIEGCIVEPGVTLTTKGHGRTVSGVAGIMAWGYGTVQNCTNGAEIVVDFETDTGNAGGIVATSNSIPKTKIIVKNCVNTGDIHITGGYAGGIAGGKGGGGIYIENSYSLGNIYLESESGSIGGVAGRVTSVINSYWYGESLPDSEREGAVGGVIGYKDEKTVVEDCYYGVKSPGGAETGKGSEETDGITDPFDGEGSTKLTSEEFEIGKAAYLLESNRLEGEGEGLNPWTQDFEKGYPVFGEPPIYMITINNTGDGYIEIKDRIDNAFEGYGKTVNIEPFPDESTETADYKLSSILVSDLEGKKIYSITRAEGDEIEDDELKFTMPEANVTVSAEFIAVEKTVEPNPEPEDPGKPNKPDNGNDDDDDKTPFDDKEIIGGGTGDGNGIGDGTGAGIGEGIGGGTDAGMEGSQGGTSDTGAGTPVSDNTESKNQDTAVAVNSSKQPENREVIAAEAEPAEKPEEEQTPPEPEKEEDEPEEPEKPEEPEEESSTVFKTIQDNIRENPAAIIAVVLVILLINGIIAFIRFRKLKN